MDIDLLGQIHVLVINGGTQQYVLFSNGQSETLAQNLFTSAPGVHAGLQVAQCDVQKAVYVTYTNGDGALVVGSKGTNAFTLDTFSRHADDHRLKVSPDGLPQLLIWGASDTPSRGFITEFGRWNGDGWSLMDLASGANQVDGDGIDLALGPDGSAHITFYEDGQRYVRID